jgi:hypothetical protein
MIRVIVQGILQDKPFLDIKNRVLSGGERGLLGMAFHPTHRKNGRFFVNYTRRETGPRSSPSIVGRGRVYRHRVRNAR